MSELKGMSETTYTISGLTLMDMECLGIGLGYVKDSEYNINYRVDELNKVIDSALETDGDK